MKYFVEVLSAEANQRVAQFLASQVIVENWLENQKDAGGHSHRICEIPNLAQLQMIHSMAVEDGRVKVAYWGREGDDSGFPLIDIKYLVVERPRRVIRRTKEYKRIMGLIPKGATT